MKNLALSNKSKRMVRKSSMELVPEVLAGNKTSIARMITRAETGDEEAWGALAEIYRHAGNAHIIGITGVPGAGKSTLIAALINAYSSCGNKVGVIAVDPSSPFSGGAIMGDRVRMIDCGETNQAFVRSMATRGHLGGVAKSTLQAVDILDASGYSPVIIETVGVGQDEVEIMTVAHTIVVLSAPGLGDDIQAIKAGILEIADIHAVSKGDKPEAEVTAGELKRMIMMNSTQSNTSWETPVLTVSSNTGEGIENLQRAISDHLKHLKKSGELLQRERAISKNRILNITKDLIRQKFDQGTNEFKDQLNAVINRVVDPMHAATQLLRKGMEVFEKSHGDEATENDA